MPSVQEIELSKIQNNKLNPRLDINPQEIDELIQSIRTVGILQPIIVRPIGSEKFEIVVGQRRFIAANKIGMKTIPAFVREYSDDEVVELNLVENIQRAELSAVEKGRSCKELMEKYPRLYSNIDAVASKIGVSGTTLRSWLQLVEAPLEIQKMVAPAQKIGVPRETGKIDWDTAVSITRRIDSKERQVEVAKEIARKPIYRREAREVISRAAREPEKSVETLIREVLETPYELPFRIGHMDPILNGTKTQTSRKGIPDPKVRLGAKIHAAVWEPHFAELRITSIERKRLGDFTEEDARREGGYTLEHFKEVWKNLHGEWNENESVFVIQFVKEKGR
ncbi:ParB/RepB/Spo0J family partition protein [Candidatus Bathyarchaeota archaeon]|nr:ParB/RepB/Spo0J family partition protein [Candidatus Bathyarchaeota archaeon]